MTVRTPEELDLILRDNGGGQGSAQNIRDLVDSIKANTGAGLYTPAESADWNFEGTATIAGALDDIASVVAGLGAAIQVDYTPGETNDWPGDDPTDVQAALDTAAARITDSEAVPLDHLYTPADTNDWPGADPTTIAGALDLLAARLNVLEP